MKTVLKIQCMALLILIQSNEIMAAAISIDSKLLNIVNTDRDETSCTFSPDRKMFIFSRAAKGVLNGDLYSTELKGGKWTKPAPIPGINSDADDTTPFFSHDGKTLYFASNRPGSLKSGKAAQPSYDIYFSEIKSGKWSTPEQLFGVVNTMSDELYPSVTKDGNTIYFTRISAGTAAKRTIVKVTKKNDFWEDVRTVKIKGDKDITPSSVVKSAYRDAYIYTGFTDGSETRDIFFATISGGNVNKITEDKALNSDSDEISFCEISSSELLISTDNGGISGSYDIFQKKITETVTALITESDITIKTEIKGYTSNEGINVKLLFFKSVKPDSKIIRSEIKQPDSNGDLKLRVTSDIKKILAIPGNTDMKEFVLEILPGRNTLTPSIKIEKRSEKEFKIRPVYFEFNSSSMQVADIPYIHELIDYLRKNETVTLTIEGYADGIGTLNANRNISFRRAESIKEYLVKSGIDKKRVKTAGHGFLKNQPLDTFQYNRRVEFIMNE